MNLHPARLFTTEYGHFVSCNNRSASANLYFQISVEIFEEILKHFTQEKEVLDRLAKEHPQVYRDVRLKHIAHGPLTIFLRSEEELTMMRYYLQCQSVCGSQIWPLARVEETSQYHLK